MVTARQISREGEKRIIHEEHLAVMGSQSEFQRQPQAGASSRLLPRYVVLYCADNAKVGMMGTSDRSKLWIMSRESTMEPQSLQKLREHAKKFGFRLTDLTSVPQLWKKDKVSKQHDPNKGCCPRV